MKHGNEENTTQLRISTPGFIPVSSTPVSSTAVLSNPVSSTAVSSTHFLGGGGVASLWYFIMVHVLTAHDVQGLSQYS